MKKYKLWKILTIVFAFLTAVMIAGYVVANMFRTTLNWVLNINPTRTESADGAGPTLYPSDYSKKDASGNPLLNSNYKEQIDTAKLSADADAVVQEVAREGIVLLKNDGALPLEKNTTVGLFGQSVDNPVTSGTGSGQTGVSKDHTYRTTLENAGLKVNEATWNFYTSGAGSNKAIAVPSMHGFDEVFAINEVPWSTIKADSTYSAMVKNDTALVVFSRTGGEGYDLASGANSLSSEWNNQAEGIKGRTTVDALSVGDGSLTGDNFLELNADERSVLEGLASEKTKGTIKNIVVVLNTPNAMELDFLSPEICGKDYKIDACLQMGPVGKSGLAALGQVLTGYNGSQQFSPSGKLVDTYAYDNLMEPSIYNFGENKYANYDSSYKSKADAQDGQQHLNQKYYTVYREGIYVGYRYHETRYEDYVLGNTANEAYRYEDVVAYSFGHGLSYTNFTYSDFTVKENDDNTFTATVKVKNVGNWAGKEVVELYVQTPYTQYDRENGIEKASVELAGYAKTDLLAPQAEQEVTITVDKDMLTAYDSNKAKTYIMDVGNYYFTLGNGAHDALNAIIENKADAEGAQIHEDRMVEAPEKINYAGEGRVFTWKVEGNAMQPELFNTSSSTGAEITNHFDSLDINKYSGKGDNSVEYVSRSDWMGTFDVTSLATMKASAVVLNMTDQMFEEVTNTYYARPADADDYEMPVMGANNGLTLAMFVGTPIDGTIEKEVNGITRTYTWDDLFDQMTYKEMANLVINGQHATQAVTSIGKPATKDENGPSGFNVTFGGGNVGSGTAHASPVLRASTWNQELVTRVGELIGEDGHAAGRNGIYGPAANTHRNAYGGRNFEYYSEDPLISATIGASECKGIQSKGVIVYEKHFALNDGETHREGNGVWSNEQATREIYLEAFREIMKIDGANAQATMSGFNRLGTTWCGASSALMENVLRGEWGFNGFVATDMDNCNTNVLCTGYMHIAAALAGGTNIYDGSGNPLNHDREDQLDGFRNDAYMMTRLREAAEHVVYTVGQSAAMNGISPNARIYEIMPWWEAAIVACLVVFAVGLAGSVTMWVLNAVGVVNFPKSKKAAKASVTKDKTE